MSADTVQPTALPLMAVVSGLLFTAARPISIDNLCQVTGASVDEIEAVLDGLRSMFCTEQTGFSLASVNGGLQFRSAPEMAFYVRRLTPPRVRRLSRAAAETLAVVAYKQPIQRAEIEAIRGVDALPTLKTLLEQKLIRVIGHEDVIGQPALYATTPIFLERFGLNDLADLPTVRELEQIDREPGEELPEADAPGEHTSDEAA